MKTKQKYFYCYTRELKDYLKDCGHIYVTTAKAISNDKQFWLFERNDNLIADYYTYKDKILSD